MRLNRRAISTTLVALGLAGSALATELPEIERILVPVLGTFHGRDGTLWHNELIVVNPTETAFIFSETAPVCGLTNCSTLLEPGLVRTYGRGSNLGAFILSPGEMFVVEKAYAKRVRMFLRTYDSSRNQESWGTAVPVVLERDFFTEPLELVAVPTDAEFRTNLRIYDPDATNAGEVRVLFLEHKTGQELASVVVPLRDGTNRDAGGGMLFQWYSDPSWGQILDVAAAYPEILSAEIVRIRVEPVTPSLRFWAFASVTNNSTQEVTIVAP